MNEDLMNVTMLENKEIVVTDTIEEIAIEENKIDSVVAEETVYEIDVRPEDIDVIDISEGMGWVGGDNRYHNSLLGIDGPNQHPITSITGLREELDEIERIKSIYSDKYNVANYYKWRDAAYDESGYFVSLVPDSSTIQICNGSNIFGVSVDNAGFIGGQDGSAPRDNTYGLIVTSGLVSVRAELDVNIGDYVNCNTKGYAKSSASNYGYRVLALENKHGVHYATIMLGVQADITDAIGADVIALDGRLDAAETNIVSAINVANQAYQKASEIDVSNKDMSNKVDVAIGKVDNMVSNMENLETQISSSASVAAQAQAIAQSAATSAESMRIEAVDKVGDVLSETSNLRREFETKSIEIESELNDAIREMQNTKESMESMNAEIQGDIDDVNTEFKKLTKELEPLAVWPEGSSVTDANGIAGFVARANKDSVTIASMAKLEGEFGEAIAGFAQEAATDNATVKALASYQQKDENGNPYGSFGVSSLIAQVDSNASNIKLLSKLEGEGFESLAALATQVTQNSASISTLASHIAGDFENTYDWVVDGKDTDKVYYDQNSGLYHYYKDGQWRSTQKAYEAGLKGSLAGVQQTADENAANIEMITSIDGEFEQSLAGFVSNATSENAEIKALAEYGYEDDNGDRHYGATGIMAEVSKNKSAIEAIASHEFVDANGNAVSGLAGLQAQVDDAKTQAGLVANRIVGKYTVVPKYPEGDESKIATLDIDQIYYTTLSYIENDVKKYVVRIWVYIDSKWQSVQGFGNFINTYPNVLQKDTVYYFGDMIQYYAYWKDIYWTTTNDAYSAGLTAAISGVQVVSDEHSASIDNLSTWQGETNIAMARIEQKADVNGAYIQSTVSNMDKYAVGLHSQAYGFTLTQAINILTDGMVYVPTENCTEECYYATHKEVVEVEYIGDAAPYDHDVVYYATRSKKYWYYGYDESIKQFTMLSSEELPKYSRSFTKGYLYQWLKVDGQHRWVTVDKNYNPIEDINTSAPSVYFSNKEVAISNTDSYGYWYTDGGTITNIDGTTGTYAPYTLYKWSLAHKDNGVEKYHWVAVATLAGNSQSRAVSQVKQDANSIDLRITDVEGSFAGMNAELTETQSEVSALSAWKNGESTNEAIIRQETNDDKASIVISTLRKDSDGNIEKQASLALVSNDDNSALVIGADNIDFTAGNFTIDADKINFTGQKLNIKVDATNIDGVLTIGHLPDTVAETSDIPTKTSDLTNDSGFQNQEGVVTIAKGSITADYIKTLNLEVGNQIQMGSDATISWDKINSKPNDIATITNVADAKTEAINAASEDATLKANEAQQNAISAASSDATAKANDAKSKAISEIENKGYQTSDQVTTITRNEISTATINAEQINVGDLNAFGATIGGWHVTESGIETEQETVGLLSDKDTYTLSSLVDEDVQSNVSIYAGGDKYRVYVTDTVWSNDGMAYFYYNSPYSIVGAELYYSKGAFYDSELHVVFERDPLEDTLEQYVYTASLSFGDIIYFSMPNHSCLISDDAGNNKEVQVRNWFYDKVGNVKITIGIDKQNDDEEEKWYLNESVGGTITCSCEFYSIFDDGDSVEIDINEAYNVVAFNGRLLPSIPYGLTCTIVLLLTTTNKQSCFAVLSDGSLYAKAANISGSIVAERGTIGNLSIEDGLTGYDEGNKPTLKLDKSGLHVLSDNARIQVGNLSIYNTIDKDNNISTNMKTSGDFTLQADEGAGIRFISDTSEDASEISVSITGACCVGGYGNTYIRAEADSKTRHDLTFSVTCRRYTLHNGREYNVMESTIFFTIPAGEKFSEAIKFSGLASQYLAVKKVDGTWANGFYMGDKYDGTYYTILENYQLYKQYKSNMDLIIRGNLIPEEDGYTADKYYVGTEKNPWAGVFSITGNIDLSDRNAKNAIQPLTDAHTQIFDSLQPVSYKFNQNTSNRTHIGLIAQDVKEAVENAGLTTKDFAAYCEWERDDGSVGCGLRYSEFISLCIDQIQKLKKRVEELEDKLNNTK